MRGVATGSGEFRTDSQVSVYLDDQPMTALRSRSTSAPSTSSASSRCRARRARCSDRARRPARCATSPTSRIRRASAPDRRRVEHDQGRRRELRRQRPRQHSGDRQLRDPRGRLLCGGRRLRRQRLWHRRSMGGIVTTPTSSRRTGTTTRSTAAACRALADQPGLGVDAEPHRPVGRYRRRLGIRPGARRLQDHPLLRRVPTTTAGTRHR